jgi:hypothetical protein
MDRKERKSMIQPIKDYCQCGHSKDKHLFVDDESICLADNCKCEKYIQREYVVKDKNGIEWHITNIAKFIRDNQSLFLTEDVLIRDLPCSVYRKGLAGKYSRAEIGLTKVICEDVKSWKGWTLVNRTEKKCKTIIKD